MGVCFSLQSISDENIERLHEEPLLVWRFVYPEDPEIYLEELRKRSNIGIIGKLLGKKPTPIDDSPPDLEFVEGENHEVDLDKSWHGIHYCLNLTDSNAGAPMDFITDGGRLVGNIDVGYGPARTISSKGVKVIRDTISNTWQRQAARQLRLGGNEQAGHLSEHMVTRRSRKL